MAARHEGAGQATATAGKNMGNAVLHPSQTLAGRGAGCQDCTIGGAFGYVGWKKLTTDASVARIVSEAVVGKPATNVLASTVDDARELKEKAGETVSAIGSAVSGAGSQLNGVSNFMQATSGGGLMDMLGGFFSNLGRGNVSGLSIAGLVAAAFLVFGQRGWLGKIAGLFLGMLLIGNNAGVLRTTPQESVPRTQHRRSPRRSRPRAAE